MGLLVIHLQPLPPQQYLESLVPKGGLRSTTSARHAQRSLTWHAVCAQLTASRRCAGLTIILIKARSDPES